MTPQAEQLKKSKIFTVFDVILITVVLILCLLPLFFQLIVPPQKGKSVKITHNGTSTIYSLSQNRIVLQGSDGSVLIEGTRLGISEMRKGALIVTGAVACVAFQRRREPD